LMASPSVSASPVAWSMEIDSPIVAGSSKAVIRKV
jgi:hypothetical protein